jgi:hypothetical protein
VSDDDHVVTRIEFRMMVDGKPSHSPRLQVASASSSAIFSGRENTATTRALRDAPEVPEI